MWGPSNWLDSLTFITFCKPHEPLGGLDCSGAWRYCDSDLSFFTKQLQNTRLSLNPRSSQSGNNVEWRSGCRARHSLAETLRADVGIAAGKFDGLTEFLEDFDIILLIRAQESGIESKYSFCFALSLISAAVVDWGARRSC